MMQALSSLQLIVDATPEEGVEQLLDRALGITEALDSSLTAVCAAWPEGVSLSEAVVPGPFGALMQERDLRDATARVATAFDRLRSERRVRAQWCETISHPGETLFEHALLADLVIMGASNKFKLAHADPLEIAARSGSPVLRLGAQTAAFESIVIGWKDTREARCAVRAALPLLQRARRIALAGGAEEPSSARLEDVRAYLSGHGVTVETLRLEDGGTPGAALAELARRDGYDLVVAGARAHGLWKERLFGGATRDLIAASDINWLMAN